MRHDNRGYNGGARAGAGRPKTFDAYHQVAVRLPKDMTDWVWRKSMKTGRSAAELLRILSAQLWNKTRKSARTYQVPKKEE